MDRRHFAACFLLAAAAATGAVAQVDERRRNQGGGGGQAPGVFAVLAVDTYARTVQLRGSDGTVSTARVPEGVYELSKLKPGDRIQVNFYVPDSMNPGLRVSAIWPASQ
jgi:hypothetical protein